MYYLFCFQLLKPSLEVINLVYSKLPKRTKIYFCFFSIILSWYQMRTLMVTKLNINDQECREEKYEVLSRSLITYFSTSPLSGDFKHFQISFILPLFPNFISLNEISLPFILNQPLTPDCSNFLKKK